MLATASKNKLVINGGEPVIKDLHGLLSRWPIVSSKDVHAIDKVIWSRDFSGRDSRIVESFEDKLCSYLHIKYVSLFNSGTSALHGCMAALNIGPGDEVIVPAYTFFAPAVAVLHAGAIPIFCDVDERTFNIDPEKIKKLITRRTKAVVVVHIHGLPADMSRIINIAKANKIRIIEDCAQAFGAKIGKKYCGTFGDVAAFSFMAAKQLASCGELGAVMTNNLDFINKANTLKMYGEVFSKSKERIYNSYSLGYNYIPNTIQAKFAELKLVDYKNDIKPIINNAIYLSNYIKKNLPFLDAPLTPKGCRHVYNFYRIIVRGDRVGWNDNKVLRQAIMDIMKKEGLPLRYYQNAPVPGQFVFQTLNAIGRGFPFVFNKENKAFYRNNYKINNFPNTLKIISEGIVIGGSGSAPVYLRNRHMVEAYIRGFKKLKNNWKEVIKYAKSIEKSYEEPWEEIAKLSDTNKDFKLFT